MRSSPVPASILRALVCFSSVLPGLGPGLGPTANGGAIRDKTRCQCGAEKGLDLAGGPVLLLTYKIGYMTYK